MPGIAPRDLQQVLFSLTNQSQSSPTGTPGQVVTEVVSAIGGLTTSGAALGSGVAAAVTWIALGTGSGTPAVGDTALFTEVCRAPVVASALTGLSQIVFALIGAGIGSGWIQEAGVFGGIASITPGSGTLYSHISLTLPCLKHGGKLLISQWSAA